MTDRRLTVAVVGNPNCGKSTLFNWLTGSAQTVGNWPGVTVEKLVGQYRHHGRVVDLVDLPGVYLIGSTGAGSQDERVTRDYVLSGEPDLIVDVLDASNIERNLYLTLQLVELGRPMVIVLNMADMAKARGLDIDVRALSQRLGCPVVSVVASRGSGREALLDAIADVAGHRSRPTATVPHGAAVTAAIDALAPRLAEAAAAAGADPRWAALKLVEGDSFAEALAAGRLDREIAEARAAILADAGDDADIVIADDRYRAIGGLMAAAVRQTARLSAPLTQRIDAVVLNRFLGVPVFLAAMYLMFLFTMSVGGAFVDFFDRAMGAIFVDGLGRLLADLGAPPLVTAVLTGLGSGIQTVSTFIPIVGSLFLFLSVLEDSGYMARAAFVMDRAMRAIGLPGKSFVPLIVGFGCNVPAIMATRTLDSRRDRVLTVLMAPFMSCGARLPVFALFAAAFFADSGQNVVFALYLIGLAFAVLTGLMLKSTLLSGEVTPFVLELPPYHIPTPATVVRQATHRLMQFIVNASRVIVPIVMVLSSLSAIGTDGSLGHAGKDDSVLAALSRGVAPVFEPLGVDRDNWPAAVGLFTGIFAKEAVVGTLNALYSGSGEDVGTDTGLADELIAAARTIPENLGNLAASITDPLGIDVSYTADTADAAAALDVDSRVFGAMHAHFHGPAGAFAFMLLVLLYTPCVAALGAMRQEVGTAWTLYAFGWTTSIGYIAATGFYQIATFGDHPAASALWLAGSAAVLAGLGAALWLVARHRTASRAAVAAE